MTLKNCKECNHEVSEKAKTCPNCGHKRKRTSLITILVLFFLGWIVLANLFDPNSPSVNNIAQSPIKNKTTNDENIRIEKLEVFSWSCKNRRGYMIIEGEVKNISDSSIKNLMTVGTFRKEDGTFIKSDDALIEYNPLLSGQTSPFKVMSRNNPAISKCRISFKEISGQKILHKDLKSKK